MIYTSNYDECYVGNRISISGDKGFSNDNWRNMGNDRKFISELAPKRKFWDEWKHNIGKISEEENTRFYIEHYYDEVLTKVDVMELLKNEIDPILLCYEKDGGFCHRHVLAEYIEIKYGIIVNDVKINPQGEITIVDRPVYIKPMLLDVMKSRGDIKKS